MFYLHHLVVNMVRVYSKPKLSLEVWLIRHGTLLLSTAGDSVV